MKKFVLLVHCKLVDVDSLVDLLATFLPGRIDNHNFLRYLIYLVNMIITSFLYLIH